MTRRILTIVLAIVLALIGTGAVLLYVGKANQRAIAGQKAVTVLVASQQVPAGTLASTAEQEGLLSAQKLPADSVPADAVRSITPDLSGLVFSSALPSGQLLLRPMLVTAVQTGATMPIPAGKVAVSILMCVQKAVAGYISPGEQIAVFNTFFTGPPIQGGCSGNNWSAKQTHIHTRLVLNDVPVLAVGEPPATPTGSGATSAAYNTSTATPSSSSSTQTTVLVTVAVNQADAERLIEISEAYMPYLALVTNSSGTQPDVATKP